MKMMNRRVPKKMPGKMLILQAFRALEDFQAKAFIRDAGASSPVQATLSWVGVLTWIGG